MLIREIFEQEVTEKTESLVSKSPLFSLLPPVQSFILVSLFDYLRQLWEIHRTIAKSGKTAKDAKSAKERSIKTATFAASLFSFLAILAHLAVQK